MALLQSHNSTVRILLIFSVGLFLTASLCRADDERPNPFTGKKSTRESTGSKGSGGKSSEPLPPLPSPGSAGGGGGDKKDSAAAIWHIVGISSNLVSLVDKNDRMLVLKNGDDIGDCVVAYPQIECRTGELTKVKTALSAQKGHTGTSATGRNRKGSRKSGQSKPTLLPDSVEVTTPAPRLSPTEAAAGKASETVVLPPPAQLLTPPEWFSAGTLVEHGGGGDMDLVVVKGAIKAMRVIKGKGAQIERTMGPYITAKAEDNYYTYLRISGLNIKEAP